VKFESQSRGPDQIDIDVGNRIRIQRKAINVTQAALGDELGISFQQVQKYERGANRVSASVLVRIARYLQTSVADLIGEGPPEASESKLVAILAEPGALELLQAYRLIAEPGLRRAVLSLARSLQVESDGFRRNGP
jgi:transcriptional regulator with XRE-family HTH domain